MIIPITSYREDIDNTPRSTTPLIALASFRIRLTCRPFILLDVMQSTAAISRLGRLYLIKLRLFQLVEGLKEALLEASKVGNALVRYRIGR